MKLRFSLDTIHRLFCYVRLKYDDDDTEERCWIPLEYAIQDKEITAYGRSAIVSEILHTLPMKEGQILKNDINATIISD